MIAMGLAYCDDTPKEKMQDERYNRIESKHRGQSVEETQRLWAVMQKGGEAAAGVCLRARINMADDNATLRDPVIYRVNEEVPHAKTGTKYKVYPTYDFTVPIVDSHEGVTHALRTTEYDSRNPMYFWFLEKLRMRKPTLYSFSRVNFTFTLMSKRKLLWFVENGIVADWSDPRFPTVQGLIRRGLSMEVLRKFMVTQGASRATNLMEWDKIWAMNKQHYEPRAPRLHAVVAPVPLAIADAAGELAEGEFRVLPWHKKEASLGSKVTLFSHNVLVEQADAAATTVGADITLMDLGNVTVTAVRRDENGVVTGMEAKLHLAGSVKKTRKLHWVADAPIAPRVILRTLGHLINKAKVEEGDDVRDLVNTESLSEVEAVAVPNVRLLKAGDVIQFERKGLFRVDRVHVSAERPAIFIGIPDGRGKSAGSMVVKK